MRAFSALGQRAFKRGEMQEARAAFRRIVDADGTVPQQWIQLAIACRTLNDDQAADMAIEKALAIDPQELVALILRANSLERKGRMHEAGMAYGAVAAVAPPMHQLRPELRPAVAEAKAYVDKYNRDKGQFLDRYLDQHCQAFAGADLRRFRTSVDIWWAARSASIRSRSCTIFRIWRRSSSSIAQNFPGSRPSKRRPTTSETNSSTCSVPRRGSRPTSPIRLASRVNQFAELNNSPRWSAFHLFKSGRRVDANAVRCPETMAVLDQVPQPDQPGRTPASMFSLLKPRTTIPAHVGVSNTRLVTHLALIVPENCYFRVGNDTRQWVSGKAWVFDDTIEHEARNESDKLRVVLIFDVWHPHLHRRSGR